MGTTIAITIAKLYFSMNVDRHDMTVWRTWEILR